MKYEVPSTLEMLISNCGLPSQSSGVRPNTSSRGRLAANLDRIRSAICRKDAQRHDDVTDVLFKADALMTQAEWQSARIGKFYEFFKS